MIQKSTHNAESPILGSPNREHVIMRSAGVHTTKPARAHCLVFNLGSVGKHFLLDPNTGHDYVTP